MIVLYHTAKNITHFRSPVQDAAPRQRGENTIADIAVGAYDVCLTTVMHAGLPDLGGNLDTFNVNAPCGCRRNLHMEELDMSVETILVIILVVVAVIWIIKHLR